VIIIPIIILIITAIDITLIRRINEREISQIPCEPLQQNVTFCDAERFVAFGNLNICTYAESYTDT